MQAVVVLGKDHRGVHVVTARLTDALSTQDKDDVLQQAAGGAWSMSDTNAAVVAAMHTSVQRTDPCIALKLISTGGLTPLRF